MASHSHKFSIADDEAVLALLSKLTDGGAHQIHAKKLLRALDDATRHYKESNQRCVVPSSMGCSQVMAWR